MEFLTRFILLAYRGDNKVDITDSALPHRDKNILKWAGVASETPKTDPVVDCLQEESALAAHVNLHLYKTMFRAFNIQLRLLAMKRLTMET